MSLRLNLIEASIHGNITVVRDDLEKGADVNAISNGGLTAAKYASNNGHMEIVSLLNKV